MFDQGKMPLIVAAGVLVGDIFVWVPSVLRALPLYFY